MSFDVYITDLSLRLAMFVSHESSADTAARLTTVFRLTDIEILEGSWWYDEFQDASFDSRRRRDAIALMRDGDTWSQLVPVRPEDRPEALLRLWCLHFPPHVDNSGFVGWLATHLKRVTGTGVLVICGQNAARGGIFDYWGCPEPVADSVLAALFALQSSKSENPRSLPGADTIASSRRDGVQWDLDGVAMHVTRTSEGGEVGSATVFRFEQHGAEVRCRYAGGAVSDGFLVGALVADILRFVYVQRGQNGQLDAGESRGHLARLPDGRLSMQEHFRWFTRDGAGVNVFEELAPPRATASSTGAQ